MSLEHLFEEHAKPTRVTIDFKNCSVELENIALCHLDQVTEAEKSVESLYLQLGSSLPDGHPWKEAKIEHAARTRLAGAAAMVNIQAQLIEENSELLSFIALSHDLGRPIEARRNLGWVEVQYQQGHHGMLSVKAMESIGLLQSFPSETQEIVKYAVEHHADTRTPILPGDATGADKYKYVFTCLLRDMDKLSTFANRTEGYLFDEVNKKKQAEVNKLSFDKEHPAAEWGIIDPPELVDIFASGQAIARGACKSYEAFMLQYLAWIYDINLRSMIGEAINTGVVSKILDYFNKQLPQDQYQKINQSTISYLAMQGFSLKHD